MTHGNYRMRERVVIDTDPGIDDAMALLLALQSPELEVAAITTVSGNVPVDTATRNVFIVLSLVPGAAGLPVAQGASKPRRKLPIYADELHGADGLGRLDRYRNPAGSARYPLPAVTLSQRAGADEILHQISVAPRPITLIALGPLTNIAAAIEKDPKTMARVKDIVLMGGAITVSGNVTPAAEFNIFVDPHAARMVFNAGLPLRVVPLDVTRQVKLTRKRLTQAVADSPSAIGQFLLDCTANAFDLADERQSAAHIYLHDPLAVGAVIAPALVTAQPMHVDIETEGDVTAGMTVADRRPIRPELKRPPNAAVCLSVEAADFISFFLERMRCPESSF